MSIQSSVPAGTAADQQADLEHGMPETTLCWRLVCIPGWMWRKVAVNEPVSSKLQLAGVCISLRHYGHAPQPTAAMSDLPANKRTEAGVQPPAGNGTGNSLQQPNEPSAPNITQQNLPKVSSTSASLHQTSSEYVTHTLLRQWGAEVSVAILPVGWTKQHEEPHAVPNRVIAPGQPWNLQTRGSARLNSIWESHESSGDDGTPTGSGVKSLFQSNANGHQTSEQQPGSPGLLFSRQNNPLCKPQLCLCAVLLSVLMA